MNDLEAIEPADMQADHAPYIPTPEEIRLACLAIQAEWSPEEERRRRVVQTEDIGIRPVRMEIPA